MGNVLAASGPPPNASLLTPSPFPTPAPSSTPLGTSTVGGDLSTETKAESGDHFSETNPGTLEDLHKKCKDVYPANFEGAKFMVNKGLSNHFQISHAINLSSSTPSGYKFGATYVGTKVLGPAEAYPVLLGDIDPSGNINANIIHQFSPSTRSKFVAQIQNSKFMAAQISSDYRFKDATASVTLGNPDIVNGSGIMVAQYLQNITEKVALGAEYVYQCGPQVPGGHVALVSLAGRYLGNNCVTSAIVGEAGVHVCYYHKASEQLQLGIEVDTNFRMKESVGSIGYQIDLPKANLVFRGMIDSNLNVGAVLEKKLLPLPFTFTLSGLINHAKSQSRFGIGLFIG
ncbi:hypothetical protein CHUAL_002322 [Chamberlinius hualienensis]